MNKPSATSVSTSSEDATRARASASDEFADGDDTDEVGRRMTSANDLRRGDVLGG